LVNKNGYLRFNISSFSLKTLLPETLIFFCFFSSRFSLFVLLFISSFLSASLREALLADEELRAGVFSFHLALVVI